MITLLSLLMHLEVSHAVEFEPLTQALKAMLGPVKVKKKTITLDQSESVAYIAQGPDGKMKKVVVIEKGLYKPNCTHTWAVGLDAATGSVVEIRVLEMQCTHAFDAKSPSFLKQYIGRNARTSATLDQDIHVVAKATGSCVLTTTAVKRSIRVLGQLKGLG